MTSLLSFLMSIFSGEQGSFSGEQGSSNFSPQIDIGW